MGDRPSGLAKFWKKRVVYVKASKFNHGSGRAIPVVSLSIFGHPYAASTDELRPRVDCGSTLPDGE